MRLQIIVTVTVLVMVCNPAFSQEQTKPEPKQKIPFKERIFISPDLGLQFGTVTIVNIAPKVGYRITEKFAAGLGATYIYLKDKRYQSYGYTFESNIYGGSVFTQYQLFEPVRAYAEYELLNLQTFDTFTLKTKREYVPSLLVGGGYTQSIGAHSNFIIMALFNLLDGPNSIYDNPVIRIGFNIGL